MPLPKSLLCASCKHTYPDGWRRCPYCGYDEKRARKEAEAARIARASERPAQRDRGRGPRRRDGRPGDQGGASPTSTARPAAPRRESNSPSTQPRPQRRPPQRGGPAPEEKRVAAPRVADSAAVPVPEAAPGAKRPRRRSRRRGRGREDASRPVTAESGDQSAQPVRPRVAPPQTPPGETSDSGGEQKSPSRRRRRFRRRRGGRSGTPASSTPAPSDQG